MSNYIGIHLSLAHFQKKKNTQMSKRVYEAAPEIESGGEGAVGMLVMSEEPGFSDVVPFGFEHTAGLTGSA